MADLSERLKALGVRVGSGHLTTTRSKSSQKKDLVNTLEGSWEETSRGDVFVLHRYYPIGEIFGNYPLVPAENLSWFDNNEPGFSISSTPPDKIGYIDTETSGLSGGTGIYTFLIGVGRFEGNHFHLAQFFLQDPNSESSQLAALENFLAPLSILVSYNGKSFDFPRLRTRYKLHGWPDPLARFNHIDLLYLVRRIWKNYLPTCSLGEVEHRLLGVERSDSDIPGWQVSEVYLQYLSDRDPEPLKQVFYHNDIDIVSLAALLSFISSRVNQNLQKHIHHQEDLVHIARYIYFHLSRQKGKELLELALESKILSPDDKQEANLLLASYYKGSNQIDQALMYWEKSAENGSLSAQIELAKAYEHHYSSYQEAIHWTLSALDHHQEKRLSTKQLSDLSARLKRLKRKVNSQMDKEI